MFFVLRKLILIHVLLLFNFATTDNQVPSPNVIIIGTGPSGIAAGTKLYENGIKNILWLEAENRIGGRVYTHKFAENVIEFGAEWCHGEKDNVVFEMANPLGLVESSKLNSNVIPDFITSSGSYLPRNESEKVYKALEEILNDDDGLANFNDSVGDFVNLKFQKRLKSDLIDIDSNISQYVLDWFHIAENCLEASDSWFDLSANRLVDYWDSEGNLTLNWKGKGFKTILDVLMKKYPDASKALPIDDKILLNKEVINIDWNNDENKNAVTIKCNDGTQYKADHVIITVSLGVLKERINSLFKPKLPLNKLNAISSLSFGTLNKLFFEFPYRWWPENHTGFGFVWNEIDIKEKLKKFNGSLDSNKWLLGIMGFFPIDHQSNTLLGWIGSRGREMEDIHEDEVKSKVMQLFKMFLGSNFDIPEPVTFQRSKWSTNPHFRGSYSYRSMTTQKMNFSSADLAEPLKNTFGKEIVLFAGEATSSHRFATVHGAIESGWREADRLIKLYK